MHISEIWRYPVKSMGGESLPVATISSEGIVGDRIWAVVDSATGHVASAKRSKHWGFLLKCRARLSSQDAPEDLASLVVDFPDATQMTGDDPDMTARLSELAGREVRLQYATSADKIMEMEWVAESQLGMEQAVEITALRVRQDEDSDVPVGAGLSSSAAIECALALALNDNWQLGLNRPTLALVGQLAENRAVGAPTGVMDQIASRLKGPAALMQTLEHSQVVLRQSDEG